MHGSPHGTLRTLAVQVTRSRRGPAIAGRFSRRSQARHFRLHAAESSSTSRLHRTDKRRGRMPGCRPGASPGLLRSRRVEHTVPGRWFDGLRRFPEPEVGLRFGRLRLDHSLGDHRHIPRAGAVGAGGRASGVSRRTAVAPLAADAAIGGRRGQRPRRRRQDEQGRGHEGQPGGPGSQPMLQPSLLQPSLRMPRLMSAERLCTR